MASKQEPLGREVRIVAAVVVLGAVMSILDTTIVNVALDTLSRELHAPLDTIQWVSTGYLLSLAMVIPLSGWCSERFGTKRVWMTSVAVFGLGSVLCGLAWSADSLIAFRVLQGFGGGMIMPVGMSILAQTAGPSRLGRVMALIGFPMLLGPILGPVLGGLIVDNTSWRWIFYVNVPIVALALVLAGRLLQSDQGRADAGRLDLVGVALLSPGLAGIVFGLSEVESHGGIGAPIAFGPILAGILLVAAFARHAWRAQRPLVDVRLFRFGSFSAASASVFLIGGALFGTMLVLPLYYQVARGQSALTAGLLMAPQGLGAACAMPFAGRLTDRVGGGLVAVTGLTIMTLGTLPLAFVGADTSYGLLGATLVVRGVGLGCAMMPTLAAAYACLERAAVPRATAALNALQRVGGSVGTALLAVVLQHEIRIALGGGSGASTLQPIPPAVRAHVATPLASAFANTFWWSIAMSLVAIVPAALLARSERARRHAAHAVAVPAA
ncbi:MAG TPA: MDR family MFS transporter [Conexibacter sp.]|nr:MDR family MFS transporter [Conexibacter sp.]